MASLRFGASRPVAVAVSAVGASPRVQCAVGVTARRLLMLRMDDVLRDGPCVHPL
jgi:hypothetical protein